MCGRMAKISKHLLRFTSQAEYEETKAEFDTLCERANLIYKATMRSYRFEKLLLFSTIAWCWKIPFEGFI